MERIGTALKERRIELGKSLEEMSVTTKLSTVQLKAIEDGNISFFKDDLSYLTYFVRYYSNALDLNYDELRQELDETIMEYTDAISVSRIREAEDISTSVMEKVRLKNQNPTLRRKRRIDFASIGLMALVVVIVLALGFVFFTKILPSIGQNDSKPPLVVNPGGESEKPLEPEKPTEPEKPVEPEKVQLTVKMVDPNTYSISGWDESKDAVFDIKFNERSWVRFSVDNTILDNPASTIYEKDTQITIVTKPKENAEVKMEIGFMASNEFSLNGELISIDPGVAETPGSQTLVFKFIGGN